MASRSPSARPSTRSTPIRKSSSPRSTGSASSPRPLDQDEEWLARRITSNLDREFVYLDRRVVAGEGAAGSRSRLPGVGTLREYRRYYPAGEVTSHVVGFTDIDDHGQEGLEAAFDHWLKGEPGSKRVLQDRRGQVDPDVELLRAARPGRDLRTSIDLRLQYLAYRELKAVVDDSGARSGSVVVLDPRTGEVLAMVNQPSYNPKPSGRSIGPKLIATEPSRTSSSPARASSRSSWQPRSRAATTTRGR